MSLSNKVTPQIKAVKPKSSKITNSKVYLLKNLLILNFFFLLDLTVILVSTLSLTLEELASFLCSLAITFSLFSKSLLTEDCKVSSIFFLVLFSVTFTLLSSDLCSFEDFKRDCFSFLGFCSFSCLESNFKALSRLFLEIALVFLKRRPYHPQLSFFFFLAVSLLFHSLKVPACFA